MKATHNHQNSYADKWHSPLEFEVGDHVFLRVSSTKGVMRFGQLGKLTPRYIGPCPTIEKVGELAYRSQLARELSRVCNVFHVSQLRKYITDLSYEIEPEPLHVREDFTYEKQPIEILDRREKQL